MPTKLEKMTLDVPVVPTLYGVIVFVVLFLLLVQKEILRALGRPGWRGTSNSFVGLLLVLYGLILLSRFLNLL